MRLRAVTQGPFAYRPGLGATFNGQSVGRGLLPHIIMGACMSAGGDVVRWKDLTAFSQGTDKANVIRVTVNRLRRHLAAMGAPAGVIQTVAGHGLRWDRTALEQKEAA